MCRNVRQRALCGVGVGVGVGVGGRGWRVGREKRGYIHAIQ